MDYTRRQFVTWLTAAAALTPTACINFNPLGKSEPATSRTEPMAYDGLKVYYNDAALVYLSPSFQLLFKNVNNGRAFDFRKLPKSLLKKAYAHMQHLRIGSVSDKGRRSYGNAQYIVLTFRAEDLSAAERQLLESLKVRASEEGGSAYTNPMINHGYLQERQLAYDGYISLSGDFDNVFFDGHYPAGFFADSLRQEQTGGRWWEIPLDAVAAKRQQQLFAEAHTPISIARDGSVHYRGKPMRNLADDVQQFIDTRTRDAMPAPAGKKRVPQP